MINKKKNNNSIFGIILAVFIVIVLVTIFLKPPAAKKIRQAAPQRVRPKIAIVLDDWGYSLNKLQFVKGIRYPLTCAVLPNLGNSIKIARALREYGFEIILHLPMEPKEKYRLENDTLTINMNQEQISRILIKDLDNLYYARGVSNHMGSRFTEDANAMKRVIKELNGKNIYFLDSFVTANSQGYLTAQRLGKKTAKRDIFLDNRDETQYIKAQINKLKILAKKRGWAIGIGHERKNTLMVLSEVMPELINEGYEFVFVSELAR